MALRNRLALGSSCSVETPCIIYANSYVRYAFMSVIKSAWQTGCDFEYLFKRSTHMVIKA